MVLTQKEEDLIRKVRNQRINAMVRQLDTKQLTMLKRITPDIAALDDDETLSLMRLLERTLAP